MDSMIAAAAHALATGDLLGALKRVALRDDAPALALRGIAMSQLGDLSRARELLKQAARAFGPREAMARARCVVAEAEIALVSRDLAWQPKALAAARLVLDAHGDRLNAAHARLVEARRALLIGALDDAESLLAGDAYQLSGAEPGPLSGAGPERLPFALQAGCALAEAGIAIRRLQAAEAARALHRAARAAMRAGIPALLAEVESAVQALRAPAALVVADGKQRAVALAEVEALQSSSSLIVDACRYIINCGGDQGAEGGATVHLGSRPVLFTLARMLAEAWPGDVSRHALVAGAFRAREADDSYRARLRVEIGRLRGAIRELAEIRASRDGFELVPRGERPVVVLAPLDEGPHGALLALLTDGESWSSSALSIALGLSPRTVQRALEGLSAIGKVHSFGRGPARRYTLPVVPGFPSTLLLPGAGAAG
jgi:hypothetical protein